MLWPPAWAPGTCTTSSTVCLRKTGSTPNRGGPAREVSTKMSKNGGNTPKSEPKPPILNAGTQKT
jgi:hypothetical protein